MRVTKEQEKRIRRLIRLRENAGKRVISYDVELNEEFKKCGIDFGRYEGGLNSVFLITRPSYCAIAALNALSEIKKGGANDG